VTLTIRMGLASTLLAFSCATGQAMSAADCLHRLPLSDMLSKSVSANSAHPEFLVSGANTTTETSRAIVSHAMFEATSSTTLDDSLGFWTRFCALLRQSLTDNCGPAAPLYGLTVNARSNGSLVVDWECSFDLSSDSATASLEALLIKQKDRSLRVVVLATTWKTRAAK
jgi:hypothetical protein